MKYKLKCKNFILLYFDFEWLKIFVIIDLVNEDGLNEFDDFQRDLQIDRDQVVVQDDKGQEVVIKVIGWRV